MSDGITGRIARLERALLETVEEMDAISQQLARVRRRLSERVKRRDLRSLEQRVTDLERVLTDGKRGP